MRFLDYLQKVSEVNWELLGWRFISTFGIIASERRVGEEGASESKSTVAPSSKNSRRPVRVKKPNSTHPKFKV